MERLTERDKNGTAMAVCCGSECEYNYCCEASGFYECRGIDDIIDRLAAYEDTGLEPGTFTVSEWISVNDRLPDKPGHYLICTSMNYWHGGCMDINENHKHGPNGTPAGYDGTTMSVLDCYYDVTRDWNRVCNRHVTHWMPLPTPPKEEDAHESR